MGKYLKFDREAEIDKFLDIIRKKKYIFSDESDIRLTNQYRKHYQENSAFQLKQVIKFVIFSI